MSSSTTANNQSLRVLLITGRSAEQLVKSVVPETVTVKVLPINIAAFISVNYIRQHLVKKEVQSYDLVLAPGLVQEDLTPLEDFFGIPIRKGPKYAIDIPLIFKEVDLLSLSPIRSADFLLAELKQKRNAALLKTGFETPINSSEHEFYLGNSGVTFPVGLTRPPLIMAEIVDATTLTFERIVERAQYYLKNGAEILDLGAVVKEPHPQKIPEIIELLEVTFREEYSFLISIDTLNEREIAAAIDANVDLILSVDHGNISRIKDTIPSKTGVVLIPTNVKKGTMPRTPKERVESIFELKEQLLDCGLRKLFVDPIIEMPVNPGFCNSLDAYIQFRNQDKHTPLMTCVGNVTEFIAADPVGINVLFNCIAVELGIQLLLATDVSTKCRGGIKELVKGRNLAYLAARQNTPPKDQGIEILLAKSRRQGESAPGILPQTAVTIQDLTGKDSETIYEEQFAPDPKGNFRIWIDYHKQLIFVAHLDPKTNLPSVIFSASKARTLFNALQERKLLSRLEHAFYLGRELERAEVCLFLGKSFIQDVQVFK